MPSTETKKKKVFFNSKNKMPPLEEAETSKRTILSICFQNTHK